MPIAIQESLLRGRDVAERLRYAARLGLDGVEFSAGDLTGRVPEIAAALAETGMRAAGVYLGEQDGYLAPELAEREQAISRMRQAMADAVDIAAPHVIFVPHLGGPRMPDLTPYRSPIELESEMLIWLLRTVSDLAYAIGVELDMLPVNRYESYFMNRVDQAVRFRQKIKNHPHVKVAASLFHMTLEEQDMLDTLKAYGEHLGYIQLADTHGGLLSAEGCGRVSDCLRGAGYAGWLVLTAHYGRDRQQQITRLQAELPGTVAALRQAGW